MTNDKLVTLIKQHCPGVKLIYLFGSRAKGEHSTASDWDIAVLPEHKLMPIERWQISQALANHLHAEVDFIDLLDTTTVLQMQVIANGTLLFDKNQDAALFEMQVYSMYGRLQESRKDIIEKFIAQVKHQDNSHA